MKNKKLTVARIVMTLLTTAMIGFIFGNSLMNAEDSSRQSGEILNLINSWLRMLNAGFGLDSFFVRKAAHFSEYAMLGLLSAVTVFLYAHRRSRLFQFGLPLCALTAVCDEMIQMFSEGRSCQVSDMLLDCSGALLGTLLVWMFISISEKKKKRKDSCERAFTE